MVQRFGDASFGMKQLRQIHARDGSIASLLQYQFASASEFIDCSFNRIFLDTQKSGGVTLEKRQRQETMALVGGHPQNVQHTGLNTQRKIAPNADAIGKPIRQEETDAVHQLRQRVRIFPHLLNRIRAEHPVNPQRQ